jgi:hypothetical protein
MSDNTDNVHRLTHWRNTTAKSIAQQLLTDVEQHLRDDETVGVVVCLVRKVGDGSNLYAVAFSDLPTECVVYAADKIRRKAIESLEL